jgi:hypothetical protein
MSCQHLLLLDRTTSTLWCAVSGLRERVAGGGVRSTLTLVAGAAATCVHAWRYVTAGTAASAVWLPGSASSRAWARVSAGMVGETPKIVSARGSLMHVLCKASAAKVHAWFRCLVRCLPRCARTYASDSSAKRLCASRGAGRFELGWTGPSDGSELRFIPVEWSRSHCRWD